MQNIFRRVTGWKWFPDADAVNAPEGVLLRADNTIPDRLGARSIRLGSSTLYSGFQEQRVHSLYAPGLQGVTYLLAGVDDQVYRDGASFGETFAGSDDIFFGDDSYQAFMARSTTKKKFDGTNFYNWGIAAPEFAATAVAVDALTSTVASFDSAESPAFNANEGTKTFVNNYAGTANAAMSLVPDATTGRGSVSKTFPADTDYLNISGGSGGPTDLFDIRAWLQDPRRVDKITIMFGLSTGADPFLDDYYYFTFNIRNDGTADAKDPATGSSAAYQVSNTKLLAALTPDEITALQSPEQASAVLKRLGGSVGPTSTSRPDAQQNSPSWGHFTVTRGQFIRVGHTKDRDWSTIRGFKVVYTAVPGATDAIYLDDAIWTGGGDRALTGTFQVGYRFARRFLDTNGNTVYTELSPMSPVSDPVVLRQQTMQITIPATSLSGADPQVDTVWVYLYGGWLNTFYRFVVTSSEVNTGMTIDELTNPSGSNFNQPEERVRLTSHGFTYAPGHGGGGNDLIFTIRKSELEALVDNQPFEPGAVGPPDNIVGIAGPYANRMFVLTEEGWIYPSTMTSPSCFSLYHTLDCRKYGDAHWIVKTANGIYAGFSKDIIRIAGTGAEDEAHIIVDLQAIPTNVANPPVDAMVSTDGNAIFYRSADGLMIFNGATATPVPFAGTSLLWRGERRHESDPVNKSGRFRLGIYNHDLYMLTPEALVSDPAALWKFQSDPEQQWSRFVYPKTFISIYRHPDGRLLAGGTDGSISVLESGNEDFESQISAHILTPISEGENPLARKLTQDFQFHGNTGGSNATITFIKDNDSTTTLQKVISLANAGVYRNNLLDLGLFLKIQLRITGNFNTFTMNAINLQIVQRPQMLMFLDTGPILADQSSESGRHIAWISYVEIDLYSPVDLLLDIYKMDVLHATLPVVVTPNKRDVVTLPMPRGTKAHRVRFVLRTSNPDGVGDIGFECYSFQAKHAVSGVVTELDYTKGENG